jgi:hypothetical protein
MLKLSDKLVDRMIHKLLFVRLAQQQGRELRSRGYYEDAARIEREGPGGQAEADRLASEKYYKNRDLGAYAAEQKEISDAARQRNLDLLASNRNSYQSESSPRLSPEREQFLSDSDLESSRNRLKAQAYQPNESEYIRRVRLDAYDAAVANNRDGSEIIRAVEVRVGWCSQYY